MNEGRHLKYIFMPKQAINLKAPEGLGHMELGIVLVYVKSA